MKKRLVCSISGPFVLLMAVSWSFARPAHTGLTKLIQDLDDPRYRVREEATRALEKMGDLPGPVLRKALEKPLTLETRARIEGILKKRLAFHENRARADARSWEVAANLLTAFRVIEQWHTTPTSRHQLASWAVDGMYQETKQPVPPEITRRLRKLTKANEQAMRALLHDARFHLGLRQEFDDDRDLDVCLRAVFAGLEPGANPRDRSCYIRPEEMTRLRLGG